MREYRDVRPPLASRRVRLELESLESRALPANSILSTLHAVPAAQIIALANNQQNGGLTPAQVRHAYGFDQLAFNNGNVAADGSGQTIAIVVAYDDPNIATDLHTFDQSFGLADPTLQKANLGGATVNAGWSGETALDVEWAHVVAPKANILLVESASDNLDDLMTAVDYARTQPGTSVVSMSWGGSEFASETSLDSHFTTPAGHSNVAFVAASGDDGAWGGTIWPSVSTNVLAVGGTSLFMSAQGSYSGESGWIGSGGGFSYYVNEPAYQNSVQRTGIRTTPDVAYNGNPYSGFAVYDSVGDGTSPAGWMTVGGTSAGTPQWAGILALADQGRALVGKPAIDNAPAAVYSLSNSAFHDVTQGFNGYFTRHGYDLVTGRGSPVVVQTISGLVGPTTTNGRIATVSNTTTFIIHITNKAAITSTSQTSIGIDASSAAALVQLNANRVNSTATSPIPAPTTVTALATAALGNVTTPIAVVQNAGFGGPQNTFGGVTTEGFSENIDPNGLADPGPGPGSNPQMTPPGAGTSDLSDIKKVPALGVVELPLLSNQQFAAISDAFFAAASEENGVLAFSLRKGPMILAALLAGFFATKFMVNERKEARRRLNKLHTEQLI